MILRVFALLLCLVLPAFFVKRGVARWADARATDFGITAAGVLPALMPQRSSAQEEQALRASFARLAEQEEAIAASPPRAEPAKAKGQRGQQAPAKPGKGVYVSASSVLRLANAAAMPRAAYAPALGARPAGLRLIGVSGLGIGMRDGDVLTRVLGADVTSVGDVVQRVIAARNKHVREISGEFWRDGVRWSLVVEQPYPETQAPAPAPR